MICWLVLVLVQTYFEIMIRPESDPVARLVMAQELTSSSSLSSNVQECLFTLNWVRGKFDA